MIDSSTDDASRDVVAELHDVVAGLRHVRSEPGLTHQRNVGLSLAGGEIVHFCDDDAVPEPAYFDAIMRRFEADQRLQVGGVGALVTDLPSHVALAYRRLLLLDSKREGALLRSGWNIQVFTSQHVLDVDWLSGCAMSYRAAALGAMPFDERRTGNGLGEDVDASARVARAWRLVVDPAARVQHLQSKINRDDPLRWTRQAVLHRSMLARDRVGPVRMGWVVYSVLGEAAVDVALGLRHRSRHRLAHASQLLRGVGDACVTKVSG